MQKKKKIKEKEYDVVVIGAGNGGLIAATKCAKRGLKTLLVEQHNLPGGFATSFVRGRFEFEVALHELGNFGNNKLRGDVLELFDELGIKLNWLHIDDAFRLIVDNGKEKMDYTLPFGPKEFAKACDKYESGCYKKVMNFLEVCENCYEAVRYIRSTKGNPDSNRMRQPIWSFVPSIRTTIGIPSLISLAAATKPSATISHLALPPKMLIKTPSISGSDKIVFKAFDTISFVGSPPKSKIQDGVPP